MTVIDDFKDRFIMFSIFYSKLTKNLSNPSKLFSSLTLPPHPIYTGWTKDWTNQALQGRVLTSYSPRVKGGQCSYYFFML